MDRRGQNISKEDKSGQDRRQQDGARQGMAWQGSASKMINWPVMLVEHPN